MTEIDLFANSSPFDALKRVSETGVEWWSARDLMLPLGSELPSSHYHPRTGELVLDPPQIRVTVKGIEEIRRRLTAGPKAIGST